MREIVCCLGISTVPFCAQRAEHPASHKHDTELPKIKLAQSSARSSNPR